MIRVDVMGRPMSTLVVTNCTGRKRSVPGESPVGLSAIRPSHAAGSGVEGLARAWLEALAHRRAGAVPAAALYAGRAFSDAKAVTSAMNGRLVVASAGAGLVSGEDSVAPYALTVASGPESVMPRLIELGVTSRAWWSALHVAQRRDLFPLSQRLREDKYALVLIALPAKYIELLADDLANIPEGLRIFTSPAGLAQVPAHLRCQVLPYDDRLDGAGSPRRGTRVDFPQRAMRHYIEDLNGAGLTLAEGRIVVERALSGLVKPVVPERRRATDGEVLEMLIENWVEHLGQSSRLLRYLRDEAHVACEQSRFRGLWSQARDARARAVMSEP
jgi:hypothetical protein